jgi:hypothetical protein
MCNDLEFGRCARLSPYGRPRGPVADRSKTSKTGDVRSERCHSRANVWRLAPCTPRTSNDVARPRRWCREGGCYVVVNL